MSRSRGTLASHGFEHARITLLRTRSRRTVSHGIVPNDEAVWATTKVHVPRLFLSSVFNNDLQRHLSLFYDTGELSPRSQPKQVSEACFPDYLAA
jgi:hypothetical protein